jgi:adenylate cyclase
MPTARNLVAALRAVCERCRHRDDLELLLGEMLGALETELDIGHAMVLLHDAPAQRLYTVASIGCAQSGIGSEIRIGDCGVSASPRWVRPQALTSASRGGGSTRTGRSRW